MPGERAEDRTVLEITGEDRFDFLQNLVTNDVARARTGLVYAALLSPQGKYLADFFLLVQGDAILLDVKTDLAPALERRLGMYRLRARVQIGRSALTVSRGTGPAPAGALADPRDPSLGWRLYGEAAGGEAAGGEAETDWDALRVAACVPETGVELLPEETFILEAQFERLNGVDFRKGCYVGQEVTARMKHKTTLRKGLVPVEIEGEAPVGTPILSEGKPAGTLYTQSGGRGIAYLRLDRAAGTLEAGAARVRMLS
jgi:tRNA-modifying protein YgfZ